MTHFLTLSIAAVTFFFAPLFHPVSGDAKLGPDEIKYNPVVTAFDVDVYKHTRDATKDNGNIVVNALQLNAALMMACNAANGATEKEIKALFKLTDNASCLDLFGVIFKMYTAAPHREFESGPMVNLLNEKYFTANRAYVDKTVLLNDKFMQGIGSKFNMTPVVADFAGNPEAARQAINTWVNKITEGNIKEFLPAGSVTGSERLIILNGDFLRLQWASTFDPTKTEKSTFVSADGSKSQTPYMSLNANVGFKSFDAARNIPAFTAVKLHSKYSTYSLSLLMPDNPKDFAALENALTPEFIDSVVGANMPRQTVSIKIPKFDLDVTTDYKNVLESMGVKQLFSKTADLSRMTTATVSVDAWTHHAMIEANEFGLKALSTSASAIGKLVLARGALPQSFDHPFLFIVQIEQTGYITHIGRVTKL
ncbi:uncharacterized protein LOC129582928 [Paramacrobiotus metropolitanus]|uniref:uncharacterized protein LOC129582928 n=1 Tax=Paramacrobiotus metropolitanus TaxID=2943436 RepID=UPI002445D5FF|nr:uncharacterized protein LOC129582928 [Paramacrobiotus metropolitanus]